MELARKEDVRMKRNSDVMGDKHLQDSFAEYKKASMRLRDAQREPRHYRCPQGGQEQTASPPHDHVDGEVDLPDFDEVVML